MIERSYRILEQSRDLFLESKCFIETFQKINEIFLSKEKLCEISPIDYLPCKNFIDKVLTERKMEMIKLNQITIENLINKIEGSFTDSNVGKEFLKEVNFFKEEIERKKWGKMSKQLNLESETHSFFLMEIKGLMDSFIPKKLVAEQIMKDLNFDLFKKEILNQVYVPDIKPEIKKINKSIQVNEKPFGEVLYKESNNGETTIKKNRKLKKKFQNPSKLFSKN